MNRSALLSVFVLVALCTSASAGTCSTPADAGVAICAPAASSNAPVELSAAATPIPGRKITAIAAYVNGSRVALQYSNQLTAVDYNVGAGTYTLTVNAWDQTGQVYQAKRSFTVAAAPTNACTASPGTVVICSPANGSFQPTNNVVGSVSAKGANGAAIERLQVFLDGQLMTDTTANSTNFSAGMAAGAHTISVRSFEAGGAQRTASTSFKTYYDAVCSFKGCSPGVFITSPGVTAGGSFSLSAEVRGNPAPITAMRAYVDGVQVAASNGPTIVSTVAAARGTHQLVVQAWDTTGALYKTVQTVNVQ